MEYLSDNSYLALKPETTAGTAVIPTNFVPLVSESLRTVVNHSADRRIKGLDWGASGILRGARSFEGEIVALADPDSLGHFLNMFMTKGTTTGNGTDGYVHPFTVGEGDSYTLEIQRGIYAQRYFGVKISEFRLEFADGLLQVRAGIRAMGQVSVMKLGVALSGASTSITFDDDYDLQPARGLAVGDVIVIGSDELTITAVASDKKSVSFTSTSLTYSVGEEIYLKPQTSSLASLQDAFHMGNTLVGLGADESSATSNAGAESTATPVHDFGIVLNNNVLELARTGSVDPVKILSRNKEGQVEMKQLLTSEDQSVKFLARDKQAMTIIATGKYIKSDFTTNELLTIKLNNVRLSDNGNQLQVGEYIMEDQKFEILHDSTDGKAMTVDLVNRTAGTAY